MSLENYEAEIAAFIRAKGVTRCPTACAAPSQASGNTADRAALRQRAEQLEAARQEKIRQVLAPRGDRRLSDPIRVTVETLSCINVGAGAPADLARDQGPWRFRSSAEANRFILRRENRMPADQTALLTDRGLSRSRADRHRGLRAVRAQAAPPSGS
jgi:hypothetical protein